MNASRQRPFWSHNSHPSVLDSRENCSFRDATESSWVTWVPLSVHIDMASSRGHLSSQLGVLGQRQAEACTLDLALPLFLVKPHTFLGYALCKME